MNREDPSTRNGDPWLHAMGIETWRLRETPGRRDDEAEAALRNAGAGAGHGKAAAVTTQHAVSAMDWPVLETSVRSCTLCPLHAGRRHAVFGTGSTSATWMFVGEAPGAEEDRRGLPFVGRAGQLLDAMLQALGLERDAVYIANVLKCRPPDNRDPLGTEVAQCEPYLHRQVELVAPRIIVALGRFAAQSLLRSTEPIARLRGREHVYADTGIPLVVTYHPAYLLRSPLEKARAWRDLCLARGIAASRVDRA